MRLKGLVNKSVKNFVKKYEPIRENSRRKDFKINTISSGDGYVPPKNKRGRDISPYGIFLSKCEELDRYIDSFSTQDLLYYFRKTANDNGFKYMLNFSKEGSQMKRLMHTFDNREICGMVEFLYTSEQDYLPKERLSVGLLCSSWVNTVYADFQLWLEDRYVPGKDKSHKKAEKHEWKDTKEGSSVGVW